MTESAHDKTKRKLINHINLYKPNFQVGLFYNDYDEAIYFNDTLQQIKKPVSAAFKNITMIWILRTKYLTKYGRVGFIQILATDEIDLDKLRSVLTRYTHENQLTVKQRPFDRETWVNTLSRQKLANLASYIGSETNPRRYAVTNKPKPKVSEN
ncbi:hypothetical protein ND925_17835 [Vibrio diabolicus]|uniref:hypothetical protein n=1 Tax=Vibrio harveyi group TaxID=717610 RepID=UPI001A247281|nr:MULTISPECIES: hypothetical protein [Vibrio harveyi group]MCC3845864.1 hypothetical protein [Vibrio parahaemolyticus]MCC3859444.1 hypothetical protein [Vibrio parahaemolyticus]MCS0384617.1 hypothetical protein [Vibrio diabolicus]HAS6948123.1 hypothetical protein [Vibrio parahaemolyticus]